MIWWSIRQLSDLRCFRLNMFPALWCQSPPLGMSFHILHPTFWTSATNLPSKLTNSNSRFDLRKSSQPWKLMSNLQQKTDVVSSFPIKSETEPTSNNQPSPTVVASNPLPKSFFVGRIWSAPTKKATNLTHLSEPSEFLHQKKGRLPGLFLEKPTKHPDLPFVHYIFGTNPSSCQQIMWQSVTPGEPIFLGNELEDEGNIFSDPRVPKQPESDPHIEWLRSIVESNLCPTSVDVKGSNGHWQPGSTCYLEVQDT